jgi:hypothetical protein
MPRIGTKLGATADAEARALKLLQTHADLSRANFFFLCLPCEATWIREVTGAQYRAAVACGDDIERILSIVLDVNDLPAMEKFAAFVRDHESHDFISGVTPASRN